MIIEVHIGNLERAEVGAVFTLRGHDPDVQFVTGLKGGVEEVGGGFDLNDTFCARGHQGAFSVSDARVAECLLGHIL